MRKFNFDFWKIGLSIIQEGVSRVSYPLTRKRAEMRENPKNPETSSGGQKSKIYIIMVMKQASRSISYQKWSIVRLRFGMKNSINT